MRESHKLLGRSSVAFARSSDQSRISLQELSFDEDGIYGRFFSWSIGQFSSMNRVLCPMSIEMWLASASEQCGASKRMDGAAK